MLSTYSLSKNVDQGNYDPAYLSYSVEFSHGITHWRPVKKCWQSTWHIVDTREMAGVAVIETGSYRILFSSSSGVERYRNFTCAYKRERNREMVLWYPFCVTQCAQGFMPITRKLNLQTLWSLMKTALLFCI